MKPKLITSDDLARLLGVTSRTIRNYRRKNILPPAIKFQRQVRWDADVIERWIQNRTEAA